MSAVYNNQRGYQVMFCILPMPSHGVDRIVNEIISFDSPDEADLAIRSFNLNKGDYLTYKAVKLF